MSFRAFVTARPGAAVSLIAIIILAAAGGWYFGARRDAPIPADRARVEAIVRDYILAHPEIIPEAIDRLRAKAGNDAYAANRHALETPFASAWAGAKDGDVTLVMFSDYACGFCRASLADVDRLIAEDPHLKVVWREIPILGPGSEAAARAALAAARQGQFRAFHTRMFEVGVPNAARVSAVLASLPLDQARAAADAKSPEVAGELRGNLELAGKIDPSLATPTFVIAGTVLKGAVGYEALKQAISQARTKRR